MAGCAALEATADNTELALVRVPHCVIAVTVSGLQVGGIALRMPPRLGPINLRSQRPRARVIAEEFGIAHVPATCPYSYGGSGPSF